MSIYPKLTTFISSLDETNISPIRKQLLQTLIDYIQKQLDQGAVVNLNMICTHNSRRSHFTQIWAQTAAIYYQIPQVYCYSGGTEATALFPMVAKTLENTGFEVLTLSSTSNMVYAIKCGEEAPPMIGFSKVFDHPFNPSSNFAAIMTCAQADEGCPFIAGANLRIPITYEDPKAYDNTTAQEAKYAERSLQIATEMFYVFSKINRS